MHAVLPALPRAFPDVAALARAPIDDVLAHWSGLGYYRARAHLHAAAHGDGDRTAARFRATRRRSRALPGIGRSTAAAISAFSSGARAAILDGNVKRVLARHAGIDGLSGRAKGRGVRCGQLRAAAARCPRGDVEAYTQGMMDLGATVCTRTAPRCELCPVAADCVARLTRRTDALPSPRPREGGAATRGARCR